MRMTPEEVCHFQAKFYRFGLRNGFFFLIFVSVLVLFCTAIQIRAKLCRFSVGNGLTSSTPQEVHCFLANFNVSASEMEFFSKIFA